ncbi:hypothetical protein BpHYR1_003966 [Brachionus plicatilis]|uniref:Uncharacterized protein n=1 Tax=Brachionus plicatilis TaxID=10195 RepID=A0A3M7RXF0_BRAPC|nr:hypothetical protein BpHYR1_003966 [Brachionus plicatilis]
MNIWLNQQTLKINLLPKKYTDESLNKAINEIKNNPYSTLHDRTHEKYKRPACGSGSTRQNIFFSSLKNVKI